ncbi:hypothetical protein IFM89_028521 [Coptis chinensis]|uniref:Trichome birefringence-like C-terminal domain-containing protein n=1 Tax=Coptis chinensis TaxID=261450 RepID=A0A835IBV4_9MAGN|nr:hypothetical protein IFM89_028521 [Coptis chinensis]
MSHTLLVIIKHLSRARGLPDNTLMKSFAADKEKSGSVAKIKVVGALRKHLHFSFFVTVTISPRHFFRGDWNSGGSCDNTTPLAGGKEVLQNESANPSAFSTVNGTGVKLLNITALSQLRDEGHISRYSIKATPDSGIRYVQIMALELQLFRLLNPR